MFFTIHCRLTCGQAYATAQPVCHSAIEQRSKKIPTAKRFRTHGLIFSTAAGSENKTFTKLSPNSDLVRLSKNPRIAHRLSSCVFI
jgi:hypothetical protein